MTPYIIAILIGYAPAAVFVLVQLIGGFSS